MDSPRQTTQNAELYRLLIEGARDDAIFALDPEGHVITWNSGAENITGYTTEEAIGRHISQFYPPEAADQEKARHPLEMARQFGRFAEEGWRVRKDGSRFWSSVVTSPLYDESGVLRGYSAFTRDLTEIRNHEEALRRSEERLRLLVESVRDYAIFMLDATGHIVSWNRGAQAIKGYEAPEIIGKHFSIFYPTEVAQSGWPQYELEAAAREGRFENEGFRIRKDGTRFWANVVITPIRDSENTLIGFVKITRDMTDRKRVEALEEARRQMYEFLAMLGHELRNPLAPIRNAISIMEAKHLGDPDLELARDVISRQLTNMTRLVDDLLDIGRITRGRIRLNLEMLDLNTVVTYAVESTDPLFRERGHSLSVKLLPGEVPVYGDMTRLTQVVTNLLTNAARYTPPGGQVEVSVETDRSTAVVRVKDNGIGIDADLLPHIFDLFRQGERPLDRTDSGLGIGLTLVQRLVALHGGTILGTSEGPGRGSEFVVRLSLAAASRPLPISPESIDPATGTAGRRILVVEDNRDAARSLSMLLTLWGHETATIHNGTDALTVATRFRPDVVLLDIGLPGVDGYEIARRIRSTPPVQDVTIVAVTGYGQHEDVQRGKEAGFDYHLVKPVDRMTLRRILERVD